MKQICKKYGIPRTSLKGPYSEKTKSRTISPNIIFNMFEKEELISYMEKMVRLDYPSKYLSTKEQKELLILLKIDPIFFWKSFKEVKMIWPAHFCNKKQ